MMFELTLLKRAVDLIERGLVKSVISVDTYMNNPTILISDIEEIKSITGCTVQELYDECFKYKYTAYVEGIKVIAHGYQGSELNA